jgi:two-component system response regulator AtoC
MPREADEKTRTHPGRASNERHEVRNLFVVWAGGSTTFALPARGRVAVGRGESCEIRIAHPSISRVHAALELDDRRIVVEDLGSANGTFVGGRKLDRHERAVLSRGEVLEIGLRP